MRPTHSVRLLGIGLALSGACAGDGADDGAASGCDDLDRAMARADFDLGPVVGFRAYGYDEAGAGCR